MTLINNPSLIAVLGVYSKLDEENGQKKSTSEIPKV